jgi:hypothetical protein
MNNPRFAMEYGPDSVARELRRDGEIGVPNQFVDSLSDAFERSTGSTGTDSSFESFVGYFDKFYARFILR